MPWPARCTRWPRGTTPPISKRVLIQSPSLFVAFPTCTTTPDNNRHTKYMRINVGGWYPNAVDH
jgi:hypothetical protein